MTDYDINELFPPLESKYLKGDDIRGADYTITISDFRMEPMAGQKDPLPMILSAELEKGWILNKGSVHCVAAMFGRRTSEWIGHQVTIYCVDIEKSDGSPGSGIRVRGSPELTRPTPLVMPGRGRKVKHMLPTSGDPSDTPEVPDELEQYVDGDEPPAAAVQAPPAQRRIPLAPVAGGGAPFLDPHEAVTRPAAPLGRASVPAPGIPARPPLPRRVPAPRAQTRAEPRRAPAPSGTGAGKGSGLKSSPARRTGRARRARR